VVAHSEVGKILKEVFFWIGRFGEEERQEDDYVLVVVFVFVDYLASC
jgi:hypothetical protein